MPRPVLSRYARIQLAGWSIWGVLRFALIYAQHDLAYGEAADLAVGTLIKSAAGAAWSSGLGALYARLLRRRTGTGPIYVTAILASLLVGVLWELTYQYGYWFWGPDEPFMYSLKEMLNLGITMIGWSGLYIGGSWRAALDEETARALRADAMATDARLQMLRYQVHPHFLFNALNAVRALIDEDPPGARRMVTQLAEFFRFSLLHGRDEEASLGDELGAIRNYLAIQKTRFDDLLDVEIEVEPSVGELGLPAFLIHPLVENAIKFGMETSPMPLRVRLRASLVDETLKIEVANTGRWLTPVDAEPRPSGTGTGLRNLRRRLEMLLPGRHRLHVDEDHGWVRVMLELPKGAGA